MSKFPPIPTIDHSRQNADSRHFHAGTGFPAQRGAKPAEAASRQEYVSLLHPKSRGNSLHLSKRHRVVPRELVLEIDPWRENRGVTFPAMIACDDIALELGDGIRGELVNLVPEMLEVFGEKKV